MDGTNSSKRRNSSSTSQKRLQSKRPKSQKDESSSTSMSESKKRCLKSDSKLDKDGFPARKLQKLDPRSSVKITEDCKKNANQMKISMSSSIQKSHSEKIDKESSESVKTNKNAAKQGKTKAPELASETVLKEENSSSDQNKNGSGEPAKASWSSQSIESSQKARKSGEKSGIQYEVGFHLEALDKLGKWYPAKIVAVNEKEMKVQIHFERWNSRYDEWISYPNSRLRPGFKVSGKNSLLKKKKFSVGDIVMARWTDRKMYEANVTDSDNEVSAMCAAPVHQKMFHFVNIKPGVNGAVPIKFPPGQPLTKQSSIKILSSVPTEISKLNADQLAEKGKRKKLIVGGIFQAKRKAEILDAKKSKSSNSEVMDDDVPSVDTPISSNGEEEVEQYLTKSEGTVENVDADSTNVEQLFIPSPDEFQDNSSCGIEDKKAKKLCNMDVPTDFIKWIINYLTNRTQYVTGYKTKNLWDWSCILLFLFFFTEISSRPYGPVEELYESPGRYISRIGDWATVCFVPFLCSVWRYCLISWYGNTSENLKDKLLRVTKRASRLIGSPEVFARKEFIIEEDHNHFKCTLTNCGKSFRKEKLLNAHIKHYHGVKSKEEVINTEKSPVVAKIVTVSPKTATPSTEKSLVAKTVTPSPKTATSSSKTATPSPKTVTPLPKTVTPLPKTVTPLSKTVAPLSKTATPSSKTATLSSKTTTLSSKTAALSSKTAAPSSKTATPSSKSATPSSKTATPPSKTTTPSPKVATKKVSKSMKETVFKPIVEVKQEAKLASSVTPKEIDKSSKKEEIKADPDSNFMAAKPVSPVKKVSPAVPAKISRKRNKSDSTVKIEANLDVVSKTEMVSESVQADPPTPKLIEAVSLVTMPHIRVSKRRRLDTAESVASTNLNNNVTQCRFSIKTFNNYQKHLNIAPVSTISVLVEPTKDTCMRELQCSFQVVFKVGKVSLADSYMIDVEKPEPSTKKVRSRSKKFLANTSTVIRDEIINCSCGLNDENGFMVQCELCNAWQHGTCSNIAKEEEVPVKYICQACRYPKLGRESMEYHWDHDWFKKGEMPKFNYLEKTDLDQSSSMLSTHNLAASLLLIQDVTQSLRYKLKIAMNKYHPDLDHFKTPWTKDCKPVAEPAINNTNMEAILSGIGALDFASLQQSLVSNANDPSGMYFDPSFFPSSKSQEINPTSTFYPSNNCGNETMPLINSQSMDMSLNEVGDNDFSKIDSRNFQIPFKKEGPDFDENPPTLVNNKSNAPLPSETLAQQSGMAIDQNVTSSSEFSFDKPIISQLSVEVDPTATSAKSTNFIKPNSGTITKTSQADQSKSGPSSSSITFSSDPNDSSVIEQSNDVDLLTKNKTDENTGIESCQVVSGSNEEPKVNSDLAAKLSCKEDTILLEQISSQNRTKDDIDRFPGPETTDMPSEQKENVINIGNYASQTSGNPVSDVKNLLEQYVPDVMPSDTLAQQSGPPIDQNVTSSSEFGGTLPISMSDAELAQAIGFSDVTINSCQQPSGLGGDDFITSDAMMGTLTKEEEEMIKTLSKPLYPTSFVPRQPDTENYQKNVVNHVNEVLEELEHRLGVLEAQIEILEMENDTLHSSKANKTGLPDGAQMIKKYLRDMEKLKNFIHLQQN
ncbi:PHD finger protein 20-like protein 1 [Nymphon striatum]|nr:PHD finger protein 20-like protein 1 [Nymphon striatum]